MCSIRPPFKTLGPPCYRIQGQVYYNMNVAAYADKPTNGQIFFYNTEQAIDFRSEYTKCPLKVICEIETRLREINPFAEGYLMMKDIEKMELTLAVGEDRNPREVKL